MNLKTETDVLKKVFAVNLNVNIWSAKTKLKPEDFNHAELPPGDLASLGTKKICDPNALRVFGTLKARAVKLLDKTGIRFLGGWAIPESRADEVNDALTEISKEFYQAKDEFLQKYDHSVQEWIKNNTGWEQIIANSIVSAEYVAGRIGFNWQVFKVVCPAGKKREQIASGLTNEVENLGHTLFDDVAKTAKETWSKSYLGKEEVTRKALAPLKAIHQKMADLSFVEPKVIPVANLIKEALDKIPKRGVINDATLLMLKGLIGMLQNKQSLTEYAQSVLDGNQNNEDVLNTFMQLKPLKVNGKRSRPKKVRAQAIEPDPQQMSPQLESLGLW